MNPMAIASAGLSAMSWAGATLNSFDSSRMRDHDVSYQFLVMIGFMVVGEFVGVEGMAREVETETLAEGGRNYAPHVVLKQGKEGRVTLKFGMMDRSFLWDWMEMVQVGYDFRLEVQIIQFNRSFVPVRIYNLSDAFPAKVMAASLDASSTAMAVDRIEMVYDRLTPIAIPMSGEAALANVAGAAIIAAMMM